MKFKKVQHIPINIRLSNTTCCIRDRLLEHHLLFVCVCTFVSENELLIPREITTITIGKIVIRIRIRFLIKNIRISS